MTKVATVRMLAMYALVVLDDAYTAFHEYQAKSNMFWLHGGISVMFLVVFVMTFMDLMKNKNQN